MKPYYDENGATIYNGDCREVLASLPDASIDAVVTDPPYGLAFMGKKWDYDVPGVEVWQQCLRVLKPGGHLLAFAGTRTQHRMAVNIEDAGFEIRDMIAWVYGSGFPKSLDVSKAIDGSDAAKAQQQRRYRFTEWVRGQGVTSAAIDAATGTNMGGHYTTAASQPAIMTREHLEQCRHLFSDVPEWVERECDRRSVESENMKRREVVGVQKNAMSGWDMNGGTTFADRNITAPATDEAKRWQGWGTALKPALEPITVARKPLCGTVAENVLTHGCGGLNVDGCRIAGTKPQVTQGINTSLTSLNVAKRRQLSGPPDEGRFPANLIHDGSEEVAGLFPETAPSKAAASVKRKNGVLKHGGQNARPSHNTSERVTEAEGYDDAGGSAARFFYAAKADKSDRGHGNNHPTVKPVDLMRYLVRLVCPPDGVVLDPFAGSGSTIKAARLEGFRAVGVELSAEYCDIAVERLRQRVLF